jgi:hypothetical protein
VATDDDAVGPALTARSRFLFSKRSLESELQLVVEVACAAVPGCSHGGCRSFERAAA